MITEMIVDNTMIAEITKLKLKSPGWVLKRYNILFTSLISDYSRFTNGKHSSSKKKVPYGVLLIMFMNIIPTISSPN